MIKYPMVDLIGQYKKIKPEVDKAVVQVMETAAFINGPAVKEFQKNLEVYLDVNHVITCGNGTDALQVALMALDLQPGDEVITTSFTFIATAEVIALLKLTPVLVDVLPDTFNIDPAAVEKAVTEKTKAVIPVHLFGQCANMDEIMRIAEKYNLFVIEDTAQAIGANYSFKDGSVKKAGTIGNIGCTSFFPSKNLGGYGDGGAIFTNNDELAKKIRIIVNHGMAVRYYHDYVGVNSRLDTIQAAILNIKLKHLNEYSAARQEAAAHYNKIFSKSKKIKTPVISDFTTHVFHQYTLILDDGIDRKALQEHLTNKGIASAVYYPVPLHLQKAYRNPRYNKGDFPVTEYLSNHVISLPIHTEMTDDILDYIAKSILEFVKD
jgi:dTDP-4-amino-4,6-dideoxygalactose transaminase